MGEDDALRLKMEGKAPTWVDRVKRLACCCGGSIAGGGSGSDGGVETKAKFEASNPSCVPYVIGLPAGGCAEPPASPGLSFALNGELRELSNPDPDMKLVDYIRNVEGLTGTKKSCAEGGCGACTVTAEFFDEDSKTWESRAINSCLVPVCSLDGCKVTTIEGITKDVDDFHPIQQKLAEKNGSQCGYCSAGMVMNMYSMLQSNEKPTKDEIENRFDGNICRCTGYRPILDAMHSFGGQEGGAADIEDLGTRKACPMSEDAEEDHCSRKAKDLCPGDERKLRACSQQRARTVTSYQNAQGVKWITPTSLDQLCTLMNSLNQDFELVSAHTGITGVQKYYTGKAWGLPAKKASTLIAISRIPELNIVEEAKEGVVVGANTTLEKLLDVLGRHPNDLGFEALCRHIQKIANVQVRGLASVGGNLAMAWKYPSFPSDLFTIFAAMGVQVTIADAATKRTRTISMAEVDNFKIWSTHGHSMVIVSVFIPFVTDASGDGGNVSFKTYKIAIRHQNSHAYVNAGFYVKLDSSSGLVAESRICYGGVQPGLLRAPKTESSLVGKSPNSLATLTSAMKVLSGEVESDKTSYQKNLTTNLFYKFFLGMQSKVKPELESAKEDYQRPVSSGTWQYEGAEKKSEFPVSAPIQKISALEQTSGRLVYTGDKPPGFNALHGAFVLSTCACCEKFEVDYSDALKFPGVASYVDAQVLLSANIGNAVSANEELFASKGISFCGQIIGMILADSQSHAEEACTVVKVKYINKKDPILTIADAIKQKSFFNAKAEKLQLGDASQALANAAVRVKGTASCGHQHHFYMETHTASALATSSGITVDVSTQCPGLIATCIASSLGILKSSVDVKMNQAGGGFGGKGSRSIPFAMASAIASKLTSKPVCVRLDLNANLSAAGSRRPHHLDYEVGVDADGRLVAVTGTLYYLQGAHLDFGDVGGLNMIQLSIDGAYGPVKNWDLKGHACRTNTPSNTFCRGPVYLPGTYLMEQMMDHVAFATGKSPEDVRKLNLYHKKDVTLMGQTLAYCTLDKCWESVLARSGWSNRLAEVAAFNKHNRWVKRGLSLTPMKYGLGDCEGFPSFVQIQEDGSVLVQHSGCEIGQGLNTKVAQVAALGLGLEDVSLIKIGEVTSRISTRASGTGGSTTSESVCASTKLACEQLSQRMQPVRAKLPADAKWEDVVTGCFEAGVDLKVCETFRGKKEPGLPGKQNTNGPLAYMAYGVAVAEVRVDMLSGECQILRVDIVEDCGTSLNVAVDCGQIQGAYVMGLGYMLTEEFEWDKDGSITGEMGANVTNGTWHYKPPGSHDIPIEFNVSLLPRSSNTLGVLSSKAVGEPPLTLASGIASAVRHAISTFRKDSGLPDEYIPLTAPVTPERIQLATGVTADMLTF